MSTRFVAGLSVLAAVGCATGATDRALPFEVTANHARGWFDHRSEWTLYRDPQAPYRDIGELTPPPECISLVNGTGRPAGRFNALRGRHVQIDGELVPFLSLPHSPGPAGHLLSFRLWDGERVRNNCLVEHVFIARSIRATPRR